MRGHVHERNKFALTGSMVIERSMLQQAGRGMSS